MTRWLLAALACVAVLAGAPASSAADPFDTGNAAYNAGDYDEAIRQYERLIADGVRHEDLFYNLGNAYFRKAAEADDKLGHAIWNYERALRIAPDFADAAFNLDVAREAVAAKVVDRLEGAEGDPLWITIVTRFTVAQLTVAFLILDALFFACLIALRFLADGFARTGVRVGTVFTAVAGLAAAVLLWGHLHFVESVELGIVLPDETNLRERADASVRDGAQVHAGLRVHVVGRKVGWVRVRLANGSEGWLREESVGEL